MSKSRTQSALDGLKRRSGEDLSLVVLDSVETEIKNLHLGIQNKIASAMKNAVEIGRLLIEKKNELPHGAFGDWIENSNLGFELRQAQKYMRAYEFKDKLLENSKANSEFAFGNLEKALSTVKTPSSPSKPSQIKSKAFSDKKRIKTLKTEIKALEIELKAKKKELEKLLKKS